MQCEHLLKMEPIQCSETSVFNTQTPGKYPEDNLSRIYSPSNSPTVQCAQTLRLIHPDIYPSVIFCTASLPPYTCFDFQFPVGPIPQQIPLNKIKMFRILITNCTNTVWALLFFFTLDVGLLARSQYSEGPPTGHLDTGFSWFPCP